MIQEESPLKLQQEGSRSWHGSFPNRCQSTMAERQTERHGDHYKELLEKARSEVVLTCEKELRLLMQEVEQVKNRYSNRSGFSPVQRQIGQWPRSPGRTDVG